jgi:hypothetical protein
VPELSTKPKPAEPVAMTQPPVHLFRNVKETSYQPPHKHNFATTPTKPAKDLAYHYAAPIQNSQTAINIYNISMKALLVTLSPEELFAISLEVRNRLHEAIIPKQVLAETVSTHALIEKISNEETIIKIPNVYETSTNNLAPGECSISLNVAHESHTLRSINMVIVMFHIFPVSETLIMGLCHL